MKTPKDEVKLLREVFTHSAYAIENCFSDLLDNMTDGHIFDLEMAVKAVREYDKDK
jgi:hypothetical protein